jgi:hypothetical protein
MHSYQQICPDMDTGDLVLFSGKGRVSFGIRLATRSRWSHVGMAIRFSGSAEVFLWEATAEQSNRDAVEAGVRLMPLRERLRRYKGEVAVRHLDVHRAPERLSALHAFRAEVEGRPYEQSRLELLRSVYEGPFGANREELSSIFCSELVAAAYQRMGLLADHPPSNEYTPADFSSDAGLILMEGQLGPERMITSIEYASEFEPAEAPV